MGLGGGIALIVVGAILTFALQIRLTGINIHVVGVILMLAGALSIALDMAVFAPRRRRTVTTTDSAATGTVPHTITDEDNL